MKPSGLIKLQSLYSVMISSGMSEIFTLMNSGHLRGVLRYKLEMSIVMNFAPAVEMTLSNKILAAIMSAVSVATSPG